MRNLSVATTLCLKYVMMFLTLSINLLMFEMSLVKEHYLLQDLTCGQNNLNCFSFPNTSYTALQILGALLVKTAETLHNWVHSERQLTERSVNSFI